MATVSSRKTTKHQVAPERSEGEVKTVKNLNAQIDLFHEAVTAGVMLHWTQIQEWYAECIIRHEIYPVTSHYTTHRPYNEIKSICVLHILEYV